MILAKIREPKKEMDVNNLMSSTEDTDEVWHCRFGHLNQNSLATLANKVDGDRPAEDQKRRSCM